MSNLIDTSYMLSWYEEWRINRQKEQRHTPQEFKGIPVAGTSSKRYHSRKDNGKSGVIGGSRVLSHRYMSEGDRGKSYRREIKRREKLMVADEIAEGVWDYLMPVEAEDDPYAAF